jgi:hypothetical protein
MKSSIGHNVHRPVFNITATPTFGMLKMHIILSKQNTLPVVRRCCRWPKVLFRHTLTQGLESISVGTAAIQERVTAVLRSIPKEAFADSFQKLYERCQPCVVKEGDYFEGQ